MSESIDAEKVMMVIIIWYFMAMPGAEPPRICPIMVPGKDTMPSTAILAMHGAKDFSTACLANGITASR